MERDVKWLVGIYIQLIDKLIGSSIGKSLYVENVLQGELHFRAGDFKKALRGLLPTEQQGGKELQYMLRCFRTLQFILCDESRFTNAKWINGKTVRVVTVDKEKYKLLKTLSNQSE